MLKILTLFSINPLLLCPVGLYALSGNYGQPAVMSIVVFPGKGKYITPIGLYLYLNIIFIFDLLIN